MTRSFTFRISVVDESSARAQAELTLPSDGTKISITYGPQTNLATDLDPEEPRKQLMTKPIRGGAEGLEPPASAL